MSSQSKPESSKSAKTAADAQAVAQVRAALSNAQSYAEKTRRRRKARSRRLLAKFSLFVLLPTALAALYYTLWATPLYVSHCAVTVQSANQHGGLSLDSVLGSFGAGNSGHDALVIREFILSRDMLRALDKRTGYIAHFQSASIDPLTRLAKDATFEEAYLFYTRHIKAEYDINSKIIEIEIQAASPRKAQQFAQTMLHLAEDKVNRLSKQMQRDQIALLEKTVTDAEARLKAAQKHIIALQQADAEFNPKATAQGRVALKQQLEMELATTLTQLHQARSVMAPTAPKVLELNARVRSLRAQIEKENRRLISGDGDGGLGSTIAEFEMAMMEKEFAQKEYETAMASLKMSKVEAMKQSRYLATIASPSLPDDPTYPRPVIKILTVFFVLLAAYGIVSLLLSAIKEHAHV